MHWVHKQQIAGQSTSPYSDEPKYYVYVSNTKVDMLFAQIPRSMIKAIAVDFKIDLKVLSLSLKGNPPQETLYSKTRVVSRYIRENFEVTTLEPTTEDDGKFLPDIAEPATFFQGCGPMTWGIYGDIPKENPEKVALFLGKELEEMIALIGSPHHILGQAEMRNAGSRMSSFGVFPVDFASAAFRLNAREEAIKGSSAVDTLAHYHRQIGGPHQVLEFLARKLEYGRSIDDGGGNVTVLLGSPIYVAMVG